MPKLTGRPETTTVAPNDLVHVVTNTDTTPTSEACKISNLLKNNVVGPSSSIDNAIPRFDSTTGKLIQNSNVTLDDDGIFSSIKATGFDITNTTLPEEGQVAWNETEQTFVVGMPGGKVHLSVGQEILLPRRVKNETGADIKNGNLVYISGGDGTNVEISLASSDNFHSANSTVAMATEDIDDNSSGFCTTFGIVKGDATQPIDTSGQSVGTNVYLGIDGDFTFVKPTAPDAVVSIGEVFRAHATEGQIFVNIHKEKIEMTRQITKEPTGFYNNDDVVVTYDSTTRTITLSGTVEAYWQGKPIADIFDGFVSDPHPITLDKQYFLKYNGTGFEWVDLSAGPAGFENLLIAYVNYGSTYKWGGREPHGLMPWQTHAVIHQTIGTYRESGGTLADYVLNSTTIADRRPSVSQSIVKDEDIRNVIPALSAGSGYSTFYLSSTDTPNIDTSSDDIVPLSGNRPYFNEFTGGSWQQTLLSNGDFMNVWLLQIPVTADTESQQYRNLWIQGQAEYGVVSSARGEAPSGVDLGGLSLLTPESIITTQVIIQYTAGNWKIVEVNDITGTAVAQTSSPSGTFLSSVTSDSTLTGNGTAGDPLGVTPLTIETVSTSRNITSADDNKILNCNSTGLITLTVTSSIELPNGVIVNQIGTGGVEFTVSGSVIRAKDNSYTLAGRYSGVKLYTISEDEHILQGDLA